MELEKEEPEINQKECDYIGVSRVENDPGQVGTIHITPSLKIILWMRARNILYRRYSIEELLETDSTGTLDFEKTVSVPKYHSEGFMKLNEYISDVLDSKDQKEIERKIKKNDY